MPLTRWSKVNIQNRCLKNSNFSPIFQPLKTDFWKSILNGRKIGLKLAVFRHRFWIFTLLHRVNDIYHCKVHIVDNLKSLKTRLQTIANIDFWTILKSLNSRFYLLFASCCYSTPRPMLYRGDASSFFVASYFKPQKLIISMVLIVHWHEKTLISFGNKENNWSF